MGPVLVVKFVIVIAAPGPVSNPGVKLMVTAQPFVPLTLNFPATGAPARLNPGGAVTAPLGEMVTLPPPPVTAIVA